MAEQGSACARARAEHSVQVSLTLRENKHGVNERVRVCVCSRTFALSCAVPPLHLRRHLAADLKPVYTQ